MKVTACTKAGSVLCQHMAFSLNWPYYYYFAKNTKESESEGKVKVAACTQAPFKSQDKKVWDQFMSYAHKRNFYPLEALAQEV